MIPDLRFKDGKVSLKAINRFLEKWCSNITTFDATIRDSETIFIKITYHNDVEYIDFNHIGMQTIVTILTVDIPVRYCTFKQYYWDYNDVSKTVILRNDLMTIDIGSEETLEEFRKIARKIIRERLLW